MVVYNSLTRTKETFTPFSTGQIGLYTCGPTIYDYAHIGNWRTYTFSDLVVKSLGFLGYSVHYVMNLTDVGHLSGDNLGDASQGDDRMAKASEKEGVDAWNIAEKYGTDFVNSFDELHLTKPTHVIKATDHIPDQIALIEKLIKKGLTYTTSDGVYFDVGRYEKDGNLYGELSTLDKRKPDGTGSNENRIPENKEKRDSRDFALWKFFATGQKRHNMEWESPWGVGFPGWHIECSAMSMKYLGNQFDVHIGGQDLRSTHHPNEIAQSEAASGKKPFVKYWLHTAFLTVDGGRMGKSLGNAFTLHDIVEKGFSPLDLRYFYFTAHYRNALNFTWEQLAESKRTRSHLLSYIPLTKNIDLDVSDHAYYKRFEESLADDFNAPQALAVTWEMARDTTLSDTEKTSLFEKFDSVLAISDDKKDTPSDNIPKHITKLADKRFSYRQSSEFDKADQVRNQIESEGYTVLDEKEGFTIRKN